MRKQILTLSALALILASCGSKTSVDFEKPLYTINKNGDTIDKWLYDANLNMIAEISNGDTCTYEYDSKNQLIKEIQFGEPITYSYDSNGNMTAQEFGMDCEMMQYNSKNQLTHYCYSSRGKDVFSCEYQYEGPNQIEIMTSSDYVTDDDGMIDVVTETKKSIRYCIDPEYKYDTLELRDCNEKFENARTIIRKQWIQINGKYYNTFTSEQNMEDGNYVDIYTVENEYDSNGILSKYTYKNSDNTQITTYTIEGNKVTDSNGNVSVFMEK